MRARAHDRDRACVCARACKPVLGREGGRGEADLWRWGCALAGQLYNIARCQLIVALASVIPGGGKRTHTQAQAQAQAHACTR